MLYTIASEHWSAERPLTPAQARAGLYRTRDEAGKVAEERPTLAVAVRYDETRGTVVATAPAIVNAEGGVVALCPIPPALVKQVGPARFRVHRAEASAVPEMAARFERPPVHAAIAGRIALRR